MKIKFLKCMEFEIDYISHDKISIEEGSVFSAKKQGDSYYFFTEDGCENAINESFIGDMFKVIEEEEEEEKCNEE